MSPLALLQQVSATLKITKFNYSDSQSFIMRVRVDNYICDPGGRPAIAPVHASRHPEPDWSSSAFSMLARERFLVVSASLCTCRGLEGWWLGRLVKAAEVGG